MSLQVWLPLNGDLKNLGLSRITMTNNEAIVNNSGKIGKCYSFNGSNSYLKCENINLSNTGPWSASCWFYNTQNLNSGRAYLVGINNSSASDFLFNLCIYLNHLCVRIKNTDYNTAPTLNLNTWYHGACTYDGSKLKIYLNGELIKETSIITPSNTHRLLIGARGGGAGYLNGYLNDVRIYDHALSPKEVKEISNALILHLKLNNNNKIYDCSGYGNNGTIINSLTLDNTSPRYNNAIHFSATNQKIQISNLNVTGFSDSYTFSWWGKVPNYSSKMMWGFSNGVRLNGIYNGAYWNTGDGTDNPIYEPGTTTQVTAPTDNKWHHYVMVGNGSNNTCKVYINGELFGLAKTYKTISGTEIFINGWLSNTKYSYNNMSISDFRLYATVLDDNEIKKLYNISGAIDNDGNLYIRELVE